MASDCGVTYYCSAVSTMTLAVTVAHRSTASALPMACTRRRRSSTTIAAPMCDARLRHEGAWCSPLLATLLLRTNSQSPTSIPHGLVVRGCAICWRTITLRAVAPNAMVIRSSQWIVLVRSTNVNQCISLWREREREREIDLTNRSCRKIDIERDCLYTRLKCACVEHHAHPASSRAHVSIEP